MSNSKFDFCPKCGSINLIQINENNYVCKNCDYEGSVLTGTPNEIEDYKKEFNWEKKKKA